MTNRVWRAAAGLVVAALLASCGGGGGGAPAGSDDCSLAGQQGWLRSYMLDWYLWSGQSPNPEPTGYATLQAYFEALRFPGNASIGYDRWSYFQDSASYNRFFAEGETLGYGLFVNGIERQLPLKLRYVEAQSPAATAGLQRGDVIVSVNGRSAADMVAANDFAVLDPAQAGDVLTLAIERNGVAQTVSVTAAIYALTPVPTQRVIDLGNGSKAGYVVLKDFIVQAEAPLAAAFASFRAAGATELIVDLRYNGGGRISTATTLASLIAGAAHGGDLFTELRYNASHGGSNSRYLLDSNAPGPAFGRVVVLTGARTCSASELIVNGLAPHVNVVTIGGTTCGKPYGFSPVASCGNTFSAVNFQSYNAASFGAYDAGLSPTCAATDGFALPLGDAAESLTAAGMSYLATGTCPSAGAPKSSLAAARERAQRLALEPGERRGMTDD